MNIRCLSHVVVAHFVSTKSFFASNFFDKNLEKRSKCQK